MNEDSTFIFVTDDAGNTAHIIVFNDATDATMGWNVACCGETLDDYALINFENTDAGWPIKTLCGRCFENFGSDVQRALGASA